MTNWSRPGCGGILHLFAILCASAVSLSLIRRLETCSWLVWKVANGRGFAWIVLWVVWCDVFRRIKTKARVCLAVCWGRDGLCTCRFFFFCGNGSATMELGRLHLDRCSSAVIPNRTKEDSVTTLHSERCTWELFSIVNVQQSCALEQSPKFSWP